MADELEFPLTDIGDARPPGAVLATIAHRGAPFVCGDLVSQRVDPVGWGLVVGVGHTDAERRVLRSGGPARKFAHVSGEG